MRFDSDLDELGPDNNGVGELFCRVAAFKGWHTRLSGFLTCCLRSPYQSSIAGMQVASWL